MLLPSHIAKMPPDTPAQVFAQMFETADWQQFYILVAAEATRRVPAALSEAIRDLAIRDDWHDALLCYIDDCQLSIMSRTANYGPQHAQTEGARKNLHRARSRLDWLIKNRPGLDAPNPTALRWAMRQVTADNEAEAERLLAVTGDDPGRGVIPAGIDPGKPFAVWCEAAGYPYKPLTGEQQALVDADLPKFQAAIWPEIHHYGMETVFDHPFLVQRWRATLLDMNSKMRASLGLPPGMPMPYLRNSELVLDPRMPRAQQLERCEKLRKLTGLFRRQREAERAYARTFEELYGWMRAHTSTAQFKVGQILAGRYPQEIAAYVKIWKPEPPPPPLPPSQTRRWYPVNAGAFLNTAAEFGWDVTMNHPQLNPHSNAKAAGALVLRAQRPGGYPPKIVVTFRRRNKQRTVTRAWVKVAPGENWMMLQDLTAATAMLGLDDETITDAVTIRVAKIARAQRMRRDEGIYPGPRAHPFDLTDSD